MFKDVPKYYILNEDKTTSPVGSLEEWIKTSGIEDFKRRVVKHERIGKVRISTVFLGIDHRFGEGPPLLFETMIFGGNHDQYQDRCETYAEALEMHEKAIKLLGGQE